MTPEERQLLTSLFERVRGQAAAPRDAEAEAFIAEAVRAAPYAPYLLAQAVIVQEHALRAADQRLQQLEQRLRELESGQPSSGGGSFLGGLGRSLFGGQAPPSSAPPPGVAPEGPWGSTAGQVRQTSSWTAAPPAGPWGDQGAGMGGGGFLKGALGAAAGVAGGVLLANSIRGLFAGAGNPYGMASGFGSGGLGGGETIINNYYDNAPDQTGYPDSPDSDSDQGAQDAGEWSDSGDWSDQDQGGGDGGGVDV